MLMLLTGTDVRANFLCLMALSSKYPILVADKA